VLTPETPQGSSYVLRLVNGQRREEISLRPKLAVNDPALLHSAVAAGLGIGLLPEFLCRQGLAAQRAEAGAAPTGARPNRRRCALYFPGVSPRTNASRLPVEFPVRQSLPPRWRARGRRASR
jgi:DNA-binding transcriptional LysR family regulator